MGKHPIGFQHIAVLAAFRHVAVFEHRVEIRAQRRQRRLQAPTLPRHIVGDEIGDHDPRLVQHHMAERNAVIERRAVEPHAAAHRRLGTRTR